MSNSHVIKVTPAKLKEISQYYQKQHKPTPPPHSLFSASLPNVTITGYKSGKVLFQGKKAEQEGQKWGVQTTAKKTAPVNSLPQGFANWSIIGSDEVGNGSYFGPVVVCAAYVTKEQLPLLRELGVRDSKELTDTQIKKIAADIKQVITYQKLIVPATKYNQIQPTYNANHMKVALHNQAIYLLLKKIAPAKPDGILIDQFTPEKTYRRYLTQEKNKVTDNLYFITKGESHHLAVAAASIICRATFIETLAKESRQLGFTLPSGAGHQTDRIAARILDLGGLPLLEKYGKLHFANTEKAKKLRR